MIKGDLKEGCYWSSIKENYNTRKLCLENLGTVLDDKVLKVYKENNHVVYYLVTTDNEVIGTLSGTLFEDKLYIDLAYVSVYFRNKGYGTFLYKLFFNSYNEIVSLSDRSNDAEHIWNKFKKNYEVIENENGDYVLYS